MATGQIAVSADLILEHPTVGDHSKHILTDMCSNQCPFLSSLSLPVNANDHTHVNLLMALNLTSNTSFYEGVTSGKGHYAPYAYGLRGK